MAVGPAGDRRSADTRFSDFDKLVAYVGVHPAEKSSGEKGGPETSWQMAKTGNAYLRAALYRMSIVGITHNPTIRPITCASASKASRR